jgi:tRNA (guanine-N7-)-methyltransferase
MNGSQARALERWSPRYLIEGLERLPDRWSLVAEQPVPDWAGIFGRQAPLAVEIGSGGGETLVAEAQAHPDWNIVGFEVFEKALGSAMGRLGKAGITNVRLINADAVTGITNLFAPASLTEVWTFFPDPWQKKKHHKRRLISPVFAATVASRLQPGGVWRIATDWDDYAEQIAETLASEPGFVDERRLRRNPDDRLADHQDFVSKPAFPEAPRDTIRPITKFEGRAIAAGRTIHDFVAEASQ